MKIVRSFIFLSTFFLSGILASEEQKVTPESILPIFSDAVKSKNKAVFLSLFYSDEIIWLAVVDDHDLNKIRKKVPDTSKVNDHNVMKFIDWVVATEETTEVKFENIEIQSDGNVATLFCDYAFYKAGKMTNWGKETFMLVNGDDGWKIMAVAFSSSFSKKETKPAS